VPRPESQPEFLQTDAPKRIGLVLNPVALKNERRPGETRDLIEAFKSMGETALIDDACDLCETFTRWKNKGLDLIVISGGDGTMQLVIGELLPAWEGESPPRLLLIHGGTGGLVPISTGNPDPLKAVAFLKTALQEQRPLQAQTLHTLRVGDRVTFSCGIGIFRRLVSEYVTYWGRVDWSRLLFAARFAGSWLVQGGLARHAFTPCPVQVRIGDETFPAGHFVGLYASSLDRIWGIGAFERVNRPPGGFRVMALQAISRRSMLRGVPPLVRGDNERLPPELLLCGTSDLELASEEDQIIYEAEGEFYSEKGSLSVKSGPELTVIRLTDTR